MLYSSSRSLTLGRHLPSASCLPPPTQGPQPPGSFWAFQGDWPSRLPQGSTLRALQLALLLVTLTWPGLLSSPSPTMPLTQPRGLPPHLWILQTWTEKWHLILLPKPLHWGPQRALFWSLQLACAAPPPSKGSLLVLTPTRFCSKKTFFF